VTTDREDHIRSGRTKAGRECDRDPEVWVAASGRTRWALQAAAQALCEAAR